MSSQIDYTRYYRHWHDDSPEHAEAMIRHFTSILAPYLPPSHDIDVLDLGCGMGFAMLTLKSLGYERLRGWDIDAGQISAAQACGLDVELVADSTLRLRQSSEQFDLIVCLDVIEHVPVSEQLAFVTAIHAALKPGGKAICTVPNANSSLHGRWRYGDWTHSSSFTEHSLDFLLHNAGFSGIEIHPGEADRTPRHPWLPVRGTASWWLWRFFRAFRRLEMIAEFGRQAGSQIPLSLNLLAVAAKT